MLIRRAWRGLNSGAGLALPQLGHGAGGDAVLRAARRPLGVGEVGWHDVEQEHRIAGVGDVGGDAGAHDSGSQDGDAANRLFVHAGTIPPAAGGRPRERRRSRGSAG